MPDGMIPVQRNTLWAYYQESIYHREFFFFLVSGEYTEEATIATIMLYLVFLTAKQCTGRCIHKYSYIYVLCICTLFVVQTRLTRSKNNKDFFMLIPAENIDSDE